MSIAIDYLEEQIGNHIFRAATFPKPSALYLALFTTMPTDIGTDGVEVPFTNGYGRLPLPYTEADINWSEPVDGNGEFINAKPLVFAMPTGDWAGGADIVGVGLYDATTGGNLWLIGVLAGTIVATSFHPLHIPIGGAKFIIGGTTTIYLEEQIGGHIFRSMTFPKPSALYLALFTTMPTDIGTDGVEVPFTNGYGRLPLPYTEADINWSEPVDGNGEFINAKPLVFAVPTGDWAGGADIVGVGLYNAATSGTLLLIATLAVPAPATLFQPLMFIAGTLKFTIH